MSLKELTNLRIKIINLLKWRSYNMSLENELIRLWNRENSQFDYRNQSDDTNAPDEYDLDMWLQENDTQYRDKIQFFHVYYHKNKMRGCRIFCDYIFTFYTMEMQDRGVLIFLRGEDRMIDTIKELRRESGSNVKYLDQALPKTMSAYKNGVRNYFHEFSLIRIGNADGIAKEFCSIKDKSELLELSHDLIEYYASIVSEFQQDFDENEAFKQMERDNSARAWKGFFKGLVKGAIKGTCWGLLGGLGGYSIGSSGDGEIDT